MNYDDVLVSFESNREAHRQQVLGAYGRLFRDAPQPGDGALVLADLRAFCHVDSDMFDPEYPILMANRLGRFRVWQRIEGLMRGDQAGFAPSGYAPAPQEQRRRPPPAATGAPRAPEGDNNGR